MSPTRSWMRSLATVGLGAVLLLLLANCSAGTPAVVTEHCGGVACTGNADCNLSPPLCAATNSGVCLMTSPRECAWSLAITSSCLCLEHDVRLCTASGGVPGVQICTANKAHTGTYWAACIACPNCTP